MTTKTKRKKLKKLSKIRMKRWMSENNITPLTMLVASAYTGERCQGCGIGFPSVREVLTNTVYWPWKHGRIGHRGCYQRAAI